jgi:hypothetical protein
VYGQSKINSNPREFLKLMNIKDRIVAGVIAGLGANIVKIAIEQTAQIMGLSKETGAKRAAGFFISPNKYNTPQGKVVGFLSDNTIAAFLGIFASYLFTFSGKDHYLLKGAVIGNMSWSAMYGILGQMGASKMKPNDPGTALTSFVAHSAFGVTKSYILNKIADPGLYKPHYEALGVPEKHPQLKVDTLTKEDEEVLIDVR